MTVRQEPDSGQGVENGLSQYPGYAVKRLQLAIRTAMDAALAPTRLSMAQFAALRVMVDSEPISAAELARRCFITRQSMQDLTESLRSANLVRTIPAEGGHGQRLELTGDGRAALDDAVVRVQEVDRRMVRGLTPAQRTRFVAMVNRCTDNLRPPKPTADKRP
jgi:DNA-binding MarR family transcriptional regulator